jgi:hypothetical protein
MFVYVRVHKYVLQTEVDPHGGVNYKLVRKISISKFVFFIPSSYIQVEKRSFFLLQVERIVNIGLFLNFLFSLKSITGFFRRSEALTSNKHIIFWACKPTHGDDKLSAQVQSVTFRSSRYRRRKDPVSYYKLINIGLFLNFLFSLKSITGFFRRSPE